MMSTLDINEPVMFWQIQFRKNGAASQRWGKWLNIWDAKLVNLNYQSTLAEMLSDYEVRVVQYHGTVVDPTSQDCTEVEGNQ